MSAMSCQTGSATRVRVGGPFRLSKAFDEMNGTGGEIRAPYTAVADWFKGQKLEDLRKKQGDAEAAFRRTGITFAVYGAEETTERLIPFDIVPRIISASEWRQLSAGHRAARAGAQRLHLRHLPPPGDPQGQEGPRGAGHPELAPSCPEMIGVEPPLGVYSHIIGIDIVRTGENEFYVLEDNTRTPSGVSYMLENRETMMHLFPELFAQQSRVRPSRTTPRTC